MRRKTLRILGLDPGFARCGFAIIDVASGEQRVVEYGCIETTKGDVYGERLAFLERRLEALIAKHHPHLAALEKLFFAKNVQTAMKVSQARGVLLVVLARHHLVPLELTPQEIKVAATGYGKADKRQVQRMMQVLFSLKQLPTPDDAADALAVASAAAYHSRRPI